MSISAIALLLGKELGLPIAKKIVSGLKADKPGTLEKLNTLIHGGTTTVAAFQEVFGQDAFDNALSTALGSNTNGGSWTFEAGQHEYVRVASVVFDS